MLIDNKKNGKVGDVLKSSIKNNSKLSIISGYFTIYSYHYLKKELNNIDDIRLLFSSSTFKNDIDLLNATPEENKLKNKLQQVKIAKECANWLKNKSEVKEVKTNNSIPFNLYHIDNKGNEDLSEKQRTTSNLLDTLNFDYFKLLDLITIARSRKHIQKYYDTTDIGEFPTRLKPKNIKSDIDTDGSFPALSEINKTIRKLTLCAYSPLKYVLPYKKEEYEEKYDTKTSKGVFKQSDRENSLIHLMRVNLLKRMESSINSFSLTVSKLLQNNIQLLEMIKGKVINEIQL